MKAEEFLKMKLNVSGRQYMDDWSANDVVDVMEEYAEAKAGQHENIVMRFEDLPLGARFKYKGQDRIWTKLEGSGEGLVAEYDEKYIKDPKWMAQTIACAADTVEEMENLEIIVVG